MSNWQKIETAPIDGQEIIIMQWDYLNEEVGEIDIGAWGFVEISDYDGSEVYGWSSSYGHIDEPTHWMPIPEAPKD